ncbi:MAG: anti-sigma factor antagonist [Prolixibacteraceae bacterium]|nr:anti-sigma factor antagonist [Prolixibacteraceae bacterium]
MIKTIISDYRQAKLLQIIGRLDTLAANEFGAQLSQTVEAENKVVIDASQCNYLSSTGIRALLSGYKQMKAKGGSLLLCALQPEVFQVIEMVGLHNVFDVFATIDEAADSIRTKNDNLTVILGDDDLSFQYLQSSTNACNAKIIKNELMAFGELGLSFGVGALSETDEPVNAGVYFTLGNCVGFFPANQTVEADFRIALNNSMFAANVGFGISFGEAISGRLTAQKSSIVAFSKFAEAVDDLLPKIEVNTNLAGLLIYSVVEGKPAISFAVKFNKIDSVEGTENWFEYANKLKTKNQINNWLGITLVLSEGHRPEHDAKVFEWLKQLLTIENVLEIRCFDVEKALIDPSVFLVSTQKLLNAGDVQLKIETGEGLDISKSHRFLIRNLYTDSARVELKPLHGGFSAQTYFVSSFDAKGRKMRPTVLKTAPRAMIAREADSCRKYAMPYILNNSAMVLGEVFLANAGALRYNFVGIGGEDSKLKWLTDYYTEWDYEKLEPLFDKIFLKILHPWYGQPVEQNIKPFVDHDPTRTFFPHIFETAEKVLGISVKEQFIQISESDEKMLNPYWFLKNVYPKNVHKEIGFLSSICHGDLNMQNILLDEAMNVYLIDFSETKPRSMVSDFARLEAIFMIDFAPVDQSTDMANFVQIMRKMYNPEHFSDQSLIQQQTPEYKLKKNMSLAFKMRQYALQTAINQNTEFAYFMALLEWVLPVVCYRETYERKRLSMIVASLLCAEVIQLAQIE